MITNNHSWSFGVTPNKSLDSFGPSIPIHLPGDPLANHRRKDCVLPTRPFAAPTCPTSPIRPTSPTFALGLRAIDLFDLLRIRSFFIRYVACRQSLSRRPAL